MVLNLVMMEKLLITIKMDKRVNNGGSRKGSGRKKADRKSVCFRLNESEEKLMRDYEKKIKSSTKL